MRIRAANLDDVIERRRREDVVGGERLTEMRIDFVLPGDDETLLSVGGVWDRRTSPVLGYLDDRTAETAVLVTIHPGQLKAVRWFAGWLRAHGDRRSSPPTLTQAEVDAFVLDVDPDHAYSALFAGGRRAGKTWLAVALCVCYAVLFPGSIVWLVSPNAQKQDELKRYVALFVAAEWIEHETDAGGWDLINGSRLMLKSAYGTGDGLKEGEANLVLLNEGQMMKPRAYTVARGAVIDKAGLVLVCANPPVEAKDEQWVADFAIEAMAGRRASVLVQFSSLENPHIDRRSLLAFRSDVDQRTFDVEVLGLFMGRLGVVAYNWNRLENEIAPPSRFEPGDKRWLPDVTTAFLELIEEGRNITEVVGLDVQRFPYIGGPVYRFFGDPHRDRVIAWIVDEIVLEGGDEEDWCLALEDKGYRPETTLIICDASGQYQHSRRRSTDSPPPEWKGRGSFDIIRSCGFRNILPPQRRMKKNPEIVDRARAFTSMISTAAGVRRLFADPVAAPKSCKAIREWKHVHGTPSRSQDVAHLGDGITYPLIRLFPRVLREDKDSGKPRGVDQIANAVDRLPAVAGEPPVRIMPPTRGPTRTRRGSGSRMW